jgi:hypothetical protein
MDYGAQEGAEASHDVLFEGHIRRQDAECVDEGYNGELIYSTNAALR